MKARPLDAISVEELKRHAVWEFDLGEDGYEEDQDETWICPVEALPVDDLGNRIVVTDLTLANGSTVTGTMQNVEAGNVRETQQFLFIMVEKDGEWQHLARYFDSDCDTNGPDALARFLGLPVADVFPIRYDISDAVEGLPEVVIGEIPAEPVERLTDEEQNALLFPDLYPEPGA